MKLRRTGLLSILMLIITISCNIMLLIFTALIYATFMKINDKKVVMMCCLNKLKIMLIDGVL